MGIFKSFKKILKTAAPLIGGTIGFAIGGPLGSAAIGSALGAGIGSLAAGADTDDALKAALLGGIGGYAASGGNMFTKAGTSAFGPTGSEMMISPTDTTSVTAIKDAGTSGIMSKIGTFAKENPFTTAGIAGLGLTALGGLDEEEETKGTMRPYPTGKSRLGIGTVGGKQYNLNNEDERKEYFKEVRRRQGIDSLAGGGEVNGPGTGTSDSVPARLSDGEFVLTAKSVRGAGGGDRDLGAARMYDMMSELERVA